MNDDGRPQDQGRPHRRKGAPAPETLELLARYQSAQRAELEDLLRDLAGAPPEGAAEQMGMDGQPIRKRPPLKDRAAMWDLAIRIARDLGASMDPTPDRDGAGKPVAGKGPARLRKGDT